jgi:hypothetical protein
MDTRGATEERQRPYRHELMITTYESLAEDERKRRSHGTAQQLLACPPQLLSLFHRMFDIRMEY